MRFAALVKQALVLLFAFLATGFALAQSPETAASQIQDFALTSQKSGWLLASNHLYWTDSLGATWSEITPPGATSIIGATFRPDGSGWALTGASGSLAIARTLDSGQHWTTAAVAPPFTDAQTFNGRASLSFADARNGFLMLGLQSGSAFRPGILMRTTDGGSTWQTAPAPPIGGEVAFLSPTIGFNGPGAQGDELYLTTDAASTWQRVSLSVPTTLTGVNSRIELPTFTDTTHGTLIRTFITDNAPTVIAYNTSDGGLTWTPTSTPAPRLAIDAASASRFPITAGTLTATKHSLIGSTGLVLFNSGKCADGSCSQTSALLSTTNGGVTFNQLGKTSAFAPESTRTFQLPAKSNLPSGISSEGSVHPDSSSVYNPTSGVMGFDACSLPSTATMANWITTSPYRVAGIYIGGTNFSCKSGLSSLTSTYVSTILNEGWQMIPIWVGPQGVGSCSGCTNYSTTPATATTQGTAEADSAVAAMQALGLGQGSVIDYDMEAFSYTDPTDAAASIAFLQGWNSELHSLGYQSAVYSSHPEFTIWYPPSPSPSMDDIWFAYFYVSGTTCVSGTETAANCDNEFPSNLSSSYWTGNHRSRQNSSGFNSTYGSYTVNVDEDWVQSPWTTATPNKLTVSVTGSGTVASSTITNSNSDVSTLTSINCGSSCTANFAPTDTITLVATASTGYTFSAWTGCTSTSGTTCTVAMTAAETVTATFVATNTLTVNKAGNGTGTVTSADTSINCGSTCTATYTTGTTVVLTATASPGSTFSSWSGCTTATGTTCTVTVNGAMAVTATFTAPVTLTVAASPTAGGTITSSDAKLNCGATCSASYAYNATSTLTATPAAGYVFASWAGCTSTTATCTTNGLTANTTVTANFTGPVTLTVTAAPTGGGTVTSSDRKINCGGTCSASYTYNTTATLTATPAAGYAFTGWTGCTSTTATCTTAALVTATTVTANFGVPSYTASTTTPTVSVSRGSSGAANVTFTLTNGWTGTFTNFGCTISNITCTGSTITAASGTTASGTVTISVASTFSQSIIPANLPHANRVANITFAMLALPALLLPFTLRKRRNLRALNLVLAFVAIFGLTQLVTGCGGSSSPAPPTSTSKTVSVPIAYTATQTGGTAVSGTPITINVTVTY